MKPNQQITDALEKILEKHIPQDGIRTLTTQNILADFTTELGEMSAAPHELTQRESAIAGNILGRIEKLLTDEGLKMSEFDRASAIQVYEASYRMLVQGDGHLLKLFKNSKYGRIGEGDISAR